MLEVILVRHGESTANVAREEAQDARAEVIGVESRDADVPLSERGTQQARAVGDWLVGRGRPVSSVWSSPYRRARQTAELAVEAAGLDLGIRTDERLRDKELGILDTLTRYGVQARFPAEEQRRQWLGKFYYRAPGGESWADLALRIRSLLRDLPGEGTVLLFTHDALVMLFRYVCEQLDEQTLLRIAAENAIGNAAVTRLVGAGNGTEAPWSAEEFNAQDHLIVGGRDLRTAHPGDRDAQPR